ncbi:MAG TPA: hypothetical protein ENI76_02780 [Ignavibacteria bacterium]|nr:hypothetical protein [Ignavibacteria bacterium]
MEKLNKEQRETLMGSIVLIHKTVKQGWDYATGNKKYTPLECKKRKGWIVGFRYLPYGKDSIGGDHFFSFISARRPCFPCILVSFSPMMNPVQVPMDGYTVLT